MKNLLTLIAAISFSTLLAQGTGSNLRRVSREVEKTMSITSDIIDGVMTYEKEKKVVPLIGVGFGVSQKIHCSFR